MTHKKNGILIGVGVGPGDPELISLKAFKAIQTADIIAYPVNKDGFSMAKNIAQSHFTHGVQEFGFYVPMLKDRSLVNVEYDKCAKTMATYLKNGLNIACLCEGDAFFYGSFIYLYERLTASFEVEIIPAIPAFVAASAALKQPMLMLNEDLKIIPATQTYEQLANSISTSDNVAIYKVGRHFSKVYKLLEQQKLLDIAYLVENVTNHKQKITKINQLDVTEQPYFSMIIINKRLK